MTKSEIMYARAKKAVLGGNMLLSKRPEMFLGQNWPSYFESTEGIKVKDMEGNTYRDFSLMGVGTNSLGYSNSVVDTAVLKAVAQGNMSTFNCQEEVLLAEKLISLHDWSDMATFTRSGGEANLVALRIARAACNSEKTNIAFCGYHGWHDWYLSANFSDSTGLTEHLLPGISTRGLTPELAGTAFPFSYNDYDGLIHLVDNNNIGVIIMEVERNIKPENNFLKKVRDLATLKGLVLIFDECTSGFRETFGGLHLKYGVNPDLAMFGKALGNGYAINAVIGRKDIMEYAQSSFISSTFWSERIGNVAALATLKEMERMKSWEIISSIGDDISDLWHKIALENKFEIEIFGLKPLIKFRLLNTNWDSVSIKTFITQEMLKLGFLAGNAVYVSTMHTEEDIQLYGNALNTVFNKLRIIQQEGKDIDSLLEGGKSHSELKRLN